MEGINKDLLVLLQKEVLANINPIMQQKFDDLIIKKCKKHLPAPTFEEVILRVLEFQVLDVVGSIDYLKNYAESQNKALQKKKVNWLNSARRNVKNVSNSTIETACETLIEDIEAWAKDSSRFLCEFPGVEKITPKRLWLAYSNDLVCAVLNVIKTRTRTESVVSPVIENIVKKEKLDLPSSTDVSNISTRSLILYDMPMGSEKGSKLDLKAIDDAFEMGISADDGSQITSYSDYNYKSDNGKDKKVRTLVRNLDLYSNLPDDQKNQLIVKEFKSLDDTDLEIISYIYEKISVVEYIQQGYLELKLSIPDMMRAIGFKSAGSNNYRQIRNRLAKISSYRFYDIAHENGKDEIVRVFGTFDLSYEEAESSTPGEKKYNLNAPIVSLSQELLRSYVESKTISFSKEQRNQLELSLSRILFYPLHQSRLDVFIANANQGMVDAPLVFNTNYGYFSSKVQLKAKSVSGRMKAIMASLDELIKNDMLIESYEKLPHHKLKIIFKPLDIIEYRTICKELNLLV